MICPRCHRRYDDAMFCPHDGERLADAIDIKRIRSKPTEVQGTVVGGRYLVRGLLGKGAMARVFLAQDKQTGAPVAMKMLDPKHAQDKETRVRFIMEAQAAAKVTHRSIVEMLDIGQGEGGVPYLVMEFLFGESLGDLLRREKVMKPDLAVSLIRPIVEGLAAVHRAGIIHRDLKPDNLFLVGEKGSPHAAKIVDFGFAKQYEQGALTQAGVTVGTVEYMSPEQAVSDPVDARTDVYGLGVLLYRVLTGRLPFTGQEAADVLARHIVQDPPPLALGGAAFDSGVEAIVLKTLRKRPDHRYGSMEALLGDFARLDRGESLSARVPLEEPDIYVAQSTFSEKAAKFLHSRLSNAP